jgi:MFS superfamily sulfate permease-like transporter
MTVKTAGRSPAKKLVNHFDLDKAHTWAVRVLCLIFTYQWYWHGVRWDFEPHDRFSLRTLLVIAPFVFVVWNLGLFLSTTKWGLKHKVVTSLLMLPAAFASPLIVGWGTLFSAVFVASVFFVSYWRLIKGGFSN